MPTWSCAQGLRFVSENQRWWFAEGEAKGKAQGEAKGKAAGEAEGKLQGLRAAVIAALDARSLRLSRRARSRLDACADPDVLTRWVRRAVVARTEADVFAPDDG